MALKLDDLWEECKKCSGTGKQEPGKKLGGGISITPGDCNECNGRGGKTTPTGQAILDFLQRAKRPAGQSS